MIFEITPKVTEHTNMNIDCMQTRSFTTSSLSVASDITIFFETLKFIGTKGNENRNPPESEIHK